LSSLALTEIVARIIIVICSHPFNGYAKDTRMGIGVHGASDPGMPQPETSREIETTRLPEY
jgi:hypothetical protein